MQSQSVERKPEVLIDIENVKYSNKKRLKAGKSVPPVPTLDKFCIGPDDSIADPNGTDFIKSEQQSDDASNQRENVSTDGTGVLPTDDPDVSSHEFDDEGDTTPKKTCLDAKCDAPATKESNGYSEEPCNDSGETRTRSDSVPPGAGLPMNLDEEIGRLSRMGDIEYDRCKKAEASRIGLSVTVLDKEVKKRRKIDSEVSCIFPDITPWPETVEVREVLAEIVKMIRQFVICDEYFANVMALWILVTWFQDAFHVLPVGIICSPERQSGRTRLLTLVSMLVRRPMMVGRNRVNDLYRIIDTSKPTLMIDDHDTAKKSSHEIHDLFLSGYTKEMAPSVMINKDGTFQKDDSSFCPKIVTILGDPPEAIVDIAINFRLHRKLDHETVDRIQYVDQDVVKVIVSKLARLVIDHQATVSSLRPVLPPGLSDREQELWEPLLAVASLAGEEWINKAEKAALIMVRNKNMVLSPGTELLHDLREIFKSTSFARISTADLIDYLCEDQERPWATFEHGKPISPKQLSGILKVYGISSKTIRTEKDKTIKGYEQGMFDIAFARYLPEVVDGE